MHSESNNIKCADETWEEEKFLQYNVQMIDL